MISQEAVRLDPIDAVAIMTPNESDAVAGCRSLDAGLDVICDKPITNELDTALDLVERARSKALYSA